MSYFTIRLPRRPPFCRKMPVGKAKTFARFNVGAMMKARKASRVMAAIAHKSVTKAVSDANAMILKRRRLETKVKLIFVFYCMVV